jgi:NTE family protein
VAISIISIPRTNGWTPGTSWHRGRCRRACRRWKSTENIGGTAGWFRIRLDTQDAACLVFQIDLFSASAAMPHTMMDVLAREKEIRFSSRTRQVSDTMLKLRKESETIRKVLGKLPETMRNDADVKALAALAEEFPVNVVQLIYRANAWEGGARDYEFSGRTMAEHWAAGQHDVAATIDKSELIAKNIVDGKTAAFDLIAR